MVKVISTVKKYKVMSTVNINVKYAVSLFTLNITCRWLLRYANECFQNYVACHLLSLQSSL